MLISKIWIQFFLGPKPLNNSHTVLYCTRISFL
jgi:hypothetical protein